MKFTKQLFVHKIGSFVQLQTTPFFIYAFVSLKTVAYYGNYTILTEKLALLVSNILGSTGAGVGNLIAEGNKKKIVRVFWELMSIRFFTAGTLIFTLYHLIEPFISLWIGKEYLLDRSTLILILCNVFIMQTRGATDQFLFGYGLFSDTWAPATEVIISITTSIVGGYIWGLPGVLLGNIVSMLIIICIWKPFFLYKSGFQLSVKFYWINWIKYSLIITIAFILSEYAITNYITFSPYTNFYYWIYYALLITITFASIALILMITLTSGMRHFISRITKRKFR